MVPGVNSQQSQGFLLGRPRSYARLGDETTLMSLEMVLAHASGVHLIIEEPHKRPSVTATDDRTRGQFLSPSELEGRVHR